jgi:hypothetical protein
MTLFLWAHLCLQFTRGPSYTLWQSRMANVWKFIHVAFRSKTDYLIFLIVSPVNKCLQGGIDHLPGLWCSLCELVMCGSAAEPQCPIIPNISSYITLAVRSAYKISRYHGFTRKLCCAHFYDLALLSWPPHFVLYWHPRSLLNKDFSKIMSKTWVICP